MDLLNLVVKPTWREFLMDLIQTEQMDPWDIDLIKVADAYLYKVREMQGMDLRIPANVILASALLLRFKADALNFDEPQEEEYVERQLVQEQLPELVFKLNKPRSRRVTLSELITAVEQVMKQGKRKRSFHAVLEPLEFTLPEHDIEEKMKKVMDTAHARKDSEGLLLFSDLLEEKTVLETVTTLLPLLHLVQEEKLMAWQDEFFGDIFIKVLPEQQPVLEAAVGKNKV
ncbi:MAG: segregation/condensation protein A [Candidatus Micrarchaeota archaeon]